MIAAPATLREKFKPSVMKGSMKGPKRPNSGGGFGGAGKALGKAAGGPLKAMGAIFGKKKSNLAAKKGGVFGKGISEAVAKAKEMKNKKRDPNVAIVG